MLMVVLHIIYILFVGGVKNKIGNRQVKLEYIKFK